MPAEEGTSRLFVGGLRGDVLQSDLEKLLSTFQAKNVVLTPKGFGFVSVPDAKVNACL